MAGKCNEPRTLERSSYTDYRPRSSEAGFFGHFLKGEDTGWKNSPGSQLNIRHPGEVFGARAEARMASSFHEVEPKPNLETANGCAGAKAPGKNPEEPPNAGLGDGRTFLMPAREDCARR